VLSNMGVQQIPAPAVTAVGEALAGDSMRGPEGGRGGKPLAGQTHRSKSRRRKCLGARDDLISEPHLAPRSQEVSQHPDQVAWDQALSDLHTNVWMHAVL
jgi:hypothetical protein